MTTRPVHTAGGIIVDGEKILLIQHKAGGLAFAKGHIEPGESPEVAAVREVAEETGYLGKIVADLGSLQRMSVEKTGEKVRKTVQMYRMSKVTRLDIPLDEQPTWIKPSTAIKDMHFSEEAAFLQEHLGELQPPPYKTRLWQTADPSKP